MSVNIPDSKELKKMNTAGLKALAGEIRTFLIEKVSEKGGHLASNLGTVELTLALFSVFDFPRDKVIWDVGHQCYTYKLLSGRQEGFDTLRELDGMSGFPKLRESRYDCFETGHSSTSISAGLGLVKARDMKGDSYNVISVIGDGSISGGLALEGLNNVSSNKSKFIIILNDNEMSISRNVGGLSRYLTEIRSAYGYNKAKTGVKKALGTIPGIGDRMVDRISDAKDSLKEITMPNGMLFENMGITYLGPVDGHNISEMKKILNRAKKLDRPVLIHVKTVKGKGYAPAEKRPQDFHGVDPFVIETGKPRKEKTAPTYSDVFGRFMVRAAEKHEELIGITAAMSANVGLKPFEKKYPDRFFDVGIAEQHAVTFAAGLASGGLHPVFAVFSSFLQRAYDQILHDVCLQDLPVIFAVDRAGIVGKDGETHQGSFDMSFLSAMPNMSVLAPKNGKELEDMLYFALEYHHPIAIRYPKGTASKALGEYRAPIVYGKSETIIREKDIALLAFGDMTETAMQVHELLKKKNISSSVINMRFAKPWDTEILDRLSEDHHMFITMENGTLFGGIGSEIAAYTAERRYDIQCLGVGIPDRFVPQGTIEEVKKLLFMDAESVAERVAEAEEQRNQ